MPTKKLLTRYEDDVRLFPDLWQKIGIGAGIAIMLGYGLLADAQWLSTANIALTTLVGAVGMMLLTGFAGQISLGHAAFLAIGAYTAAIFGGLLGIPFWLILPLAGFLAAGVGLLVGPFALRLEGLYLAIVTIGLLALVNHTLRSFPEITQGVAGIAVPMHVWFADPDTSNPLTAITQTNHIGSFALTFEHKLFVIYALVAVASLWIAANVRRSNTGRALMAVRDHDLAAAVLGVRPASLKVIAFGVSSFFGGVAGAMYGFQQQFITIDPPFNLHMSVHYIAVIVLGGMGTVFGAAAGALFFSLVEPLVEHVGRMIPFLDNLSSAQQSTLLFSMVVIFFLIFEPLGLFGIWLRIKRYFIAWPFRY